MTRPPATPAGVTHSAGTPLASADAIRVLAGACATGALAARRSGTVMAPRSRPRSSSRTTRSSSLAIADPFRPWHLAKAALQRSCRSTRPRGNEINVRATPRGKSGVAFPQPQPHLARGSSSLRRARVKALSGAACPGDIAGSSRREGIALGERTFCSVARRIQMCPSVQAVRAARCPVTSRIRRCELHGRIGEPDPAPDTDHQPRQRIPGRPARIDDHGLGTARKAARCNCGDGRRSG